MAAKLDHSLSDRRAAVAHNEEDTAGSPLSSLLAMTVGVQARRPVCSAQ
jgi:hypothetical protein